MVLDIRNNGSLDNTPVYTVPADHYFVMGDNRDNSSDSRVQDHMGFIPRGNIESKVLGKYWLFGFDLLDFSVE